MIKEIDVEKLCTYFWLLFFRDYLWFTL